MKYCSKCGKELFDEAVLCPACGCPCETEVVSSPEKQNVSGFKKAAKVLMIVGTVLMGIYIIPLAWTIPMTVSYFKKIKRGQPVSTGFKICSLLFVSLLGGIFMLCDND